MIASAADWTEQWLLELESVESDAATNAKSDGAAEPKWLANQSANSFT